jgi:hypothetical protein
MVAGDQDRSSVPGEGDLTGTLHAVGEARVDMIDGPAWALASSRNSGSGDGKKDR